MPHVSRRAFLKGASVALSASPLLGAKEGEAENAAAAQLAASEPIAISLTANGTLCHAKVAPTTTLAATLRESLGLTGTKVSCEGGACGACSVHVDGTLVAACLTLAIDADGREVKTIEGVQTDTVLHPIQQAFLDADALQCGYCTPGMVMSAVDFYDRWKETNQGAPAPHVVKEAMSGNLCRCGAQPAIVAAVTAACAKTRAAPLGETPLYALQRHDGREKVTGTARYTFDHYPPQTLHAVFVRAEYGHAKILDVDTTGAEKMPGVVGVVLMAEKIGGGFLTARWVGQEIVAIAATTLEQAQRAANAVVVKTEPLGVVTTPAAAAQDGAPVLYPEADRDDVRNAAEGPSAPDFLLPWSGNLRGPATWPLGQRNADADDVVSASKVQSRLKFATEVQVHAPLERHVTVAVPTDDGGLDVYASTQTVQILAEEIADILEMSPSKVRVFGEYVGGGFGCKAGLRAEHLAAVKLAVKTKRPVRLALGFSDHLTVGGNRPGTEQSIALGAEPNGKLNAVVHHGRSNCGAAVGERSTGMTENHYRFDEVEIADDNIVTNGAPACPWRAPGFPANAFALEQAVDDIAAQCGKDPLLLRIENEHRRRFQEVYRLARDRSGLSSRLLHVAEDAKNPEMRTLRGVGVATAHWFALTSPSCQVRLRARRDGTIEAAVATQDMGQGARTVVANVVCETLGVDAKNVSVVVGKSELPPAPGSFGSISTGSIAPAAWKAALALQDALYRGAARARSDVTRSERGAVSSRGKLTPWRDLFVDLEQDLVEVTAHRGADTDGFKFPPLPFDAFAEHVPFAVAKDEVSSAQIAEVEVDRLLGTIRVKRVVVALDAGRIASPITARSQVVGAVMQGISYALYEARRLDPKTGRNLTDSFETYSILGIADAPDVDVHFLPAPSENNPYGSLGLGENAIIATAAAVANAVFRATGKRMTTTPILPRAILTAMGAK